MNNKLRRIALRVVGLIATFMFLLTGVYTWLTCFRTVNVSTFDVEIAGENTYLVIFAPTGVVFNIDGSGKIEAMRRITLEEELTSDDDYIGMKLEDALNKLISDDIKELSLAMLAGGSHWKLNTAVSELESMNINVELKELTSEEQRKVLQLFASSS